MSRTPHKYFGRKSSEWGILGFLNECDLEPFERKLDCYLKDLEYIVNVDKGIRKQRAQLLLNNYRLVSISFLMLEIQNGDEMLDDQPDKQLAQSWEIAQVSEFSDDEEIKFDLSSVAEELRREPITEWVVADINVTQRFRKFQMDVLDQTQRNGLTYNNVYELLALSSIIVLTSPCPYPIFTIEEWNKIIKENPYTIENHPIPPEMSSILHQASCNNFIGKDATIDGGNSQLGKNVARAFNELVPKVAPAKISEDTYSYLYLHPISRPFFSGEKEYDLTLNSANADSTKRPDLSCEVYQVAILNSESKPIGFTPLQHKKDSIKVQLKACKSINQQMDSRGGPGEAAILLNMGDQTESFIMDLKFDGLYRSWSFLTTKLVIDRASLPLAEFAISHIMALEECVGKIARDYKYRSTKFTPLKQMSFVRKLPNSPQVKMLLS
ncbi:13614_t:CDS:2 [Ambispora gerdemannii]|uniref:13614_t:CDS:1 n=1 Tax=Ambispora gerdemannii TaxID=144530 RepID=A0A9N9FJZ2_9GLOM|nr:13614_t:CDS:2 [Ambispora gerdemannii]